MTSKPRETGGIRNVFDSTWEYLLGAICGVSILVLVAGTVFFVVQKPPFDGVVHMFMVVWPHLRDYLFVCSAGSLLAIWLDSLDRNQFSELQWAINKYHGKSSSSPKVIKCAKYSVWAFCFLIVFVLIGWIHFVGAVILAAIVAYARFKTNGISDYWPEYIDSLLCVYSPVNKSEFGYLQSQVKTSRKYSADRLLSWADSEQRSINEDYKQSKRVRSAIYQRYNFRPQFLDRDINDKGN